jgi:hypothetical protein
VFVERVSLHRKVLFNGPALLLGCQGAHSLTLRLNVCAGQLQSKTR